MEIEEIAENEPDSIIRATVDPGVGMQQFQAREIAFGLGLENRPDRQGDARRSSAATACSATTTPSMLEINPLVVTARRQSDRARRQDVVRRERAVPPPEISELRDKSQEDPRETFASDRGLVLCRPRRQYRLHHQRRRPRHGDDGHDQDRRRRAGELPRHRRRRLAGAGRQVVPRRARRQECRDHPASTSSPASTAATGWPRASSRPSAKSASRFRWWCGLPAPMSRKAGASSPSSGEAVIVADTLAEAAEKAVAAMARRFAKKAS